MRGKVRALAKRVAGALPQRTRNHLDRLRLHPAVSRFTRTRNRLSRELLAGEGIEIGALHMPLWLPPGARATYVDHLTAAELPGAFPDIVGWPIVEVEVVDEAETLASLPDQSQDFLVANHVIEHLENPIAALENWLRVLRPGGVLFFAVPNRERTFDRYRPGTPVEGVARDYREGPETSRRAHYVEWVEKVQGLTGEDAAAAVERHLHDRVNIHFHAWTMGEFAELVRVCVEDIFLPLTDVRFTSNGMEFIVTARRA